MGRNLNQVVDDVGMGTYQWVQLLLVGGVLMSDGAEILVASSMLKALGTAWGLTPLIRGLMMSIIFVGVCFGGLIGGNIADVYGRRRGIICSYVGIVIFGTSTALAQGPVSMTILRFLFGVSFGMGMGPGVTLQVETAPSNWRAHIVNFGAIWFTFGEVYTAVLLVIFMPDLTDPTGHSWRWVTLLSMIPGFVLLPFAYLLLQESPHFLLTNDRRKEAIESLEYIAYMNCQVEKVEGLDSNDPEKRLEWSGLSAVAAAAAASAAAEAASPSSALLESAATQGGGRDSVASSSSQAVEVAESAPRTRRRRSSIIAAKESASVLFAPEYRSIIFGGCYLCSLCNFLFYGLTYALPQIIGNQQDIASPAVQLLIVCFCDLPGVFLAFLLIYAKGISHRAGMMGCATFACIFSLTLISIEHGIEGLYVGLASAYLLKYVSSALFILCYVYISEVFPASVRATGFSICVSAGRAGSILAPVVVESLKFKGFALGEHSPFLLVTSVLCMLGVVVIKFCLHFERKNEFLAESAPPVPEKSKDIQDDQSHEHKSIAQDPSSPVAAG